MIADRRSRLTVTPSGALLDEGVMRWFLGTLDRRSQPPQIERKSATDPFCVAVEAESRKRERAA